MVEVLSELLIPVLSSVASAFGAVYLYGRRKQKSLNETEEVKRRIKYIENKVVPVEDIPQLTAQMNSIQKTVDSIEQRLYDLVMSLRDKHVY